MMLPMVRLMFAWPRPVLDVKSSSNKSSVEFVGVHKVDKRGSHQGATHCAGQDGHADCNGSKPLTQGQKEGHKFVLTAGGRYAPAYYDIGNQDIGAKEHGDPNDRPHDCLLTFLNFIRFTWLDIRPRKPAPDDHKKRNGARDSKNHLDHEAHHSRNAPLAQRVVKM